MSIPSITIHLDFGDGDASSGVVQQASVPVPVDLGGLGGPDESGGVPTPSGTPATAATSAAALPVPGTGALGLADATAEAGGPPPEPSADIPGLEHGASGEGAEAVAPRPEGEPPKKKAARKKPASPTKG